MLRVRMILLTAVMTLSASYTFAASLGHFCWNLAPSQDLINLEVTQPTPGVGFFLLESQWESPNGYHLAGSGIATWNTQANTVILRFTAHNQSEVFFNGNAFCFVTSVLDLATLAGPWIVDCLGSNSIFEAGGTLIPIACGAAP